MCAQHSKLYSSERQPPMNYTEALRGSRVRALNIIEKI